MTETILFAEDNEDDQFMLRRSLRALPFQINLHFVNGGTEAVAYLTGEGEFRDRRKFPLPTVIFLDIKMPLMTGFEVLEWLKNQSPDHLRRLPVVVLSSSAQQEDIDRAYDLGANAYLTKPMGFDEMHNMFDITGKFFLEHAEKPSVSGSPLTPF